MYNELMSFARNLIFVSREWRFLVNQNKSKALTLNAKKLSQMILVIENFHQTVVLPDKPVFNLTVSVLNKTRVFEVILSKCKC
jgi:hypothetical protein